MSTTVELTRNEARQLTDRIKVAVEGTWLLIQEAYTSRVWSALGYGTWDEYCASEFGNARLRLPREERQEVVASLREAGLSARAIASATGVSEPTVRRDISGASFDAPAAITGADGKTYAGSRPASRPDPFDGSDWVELDNSELIEQSSLGAPHVKAVIEHGITPSAPNEWSPMANTASPKTIGPPLTDRRGRQMPQRAQRKAIADGLATLSGLCAGFARLDELDESISREEAEQWLLDLSTSLRVLRSLNTKLKEHLNGSQ